MEQQKMQLVKCLAEVLSDSVVLKFKGHGAHWNVMGPDFSEYHDLFASFYEDVDGAVDSFAEYIRIHGVQAPFRLGDFMRLTSLEDSEAGSDPIALTRSLRDANKTFLGCLNDLFKCAEAVNSQSIMDFVAGRLDAHEKWNWKFSAILGEEASLEPMQVIDGLAL